MSCLSRTAQSRWWLVTLFVLLVTVGCRGNDDPSDEEQGVREAANGLLGQVLTGSYDQAWDSLHPAHQAIVSRELLIDCGNRFPPAFESHEIDRVSEIDFKFDDIEQTEGWQLVVVYELTDEFKAQWNADSPIDRSLYFTQIENQWRWVLSQGELDSFREGNCGIPWPGA